MQKFIPLALVALLAIGCKGGDGGSTAVDSPGTAAATTGSTAAPSTGGEYTLKFAPKQGDKVSYEMVIDASGMKMGMGMTMACEKVEGEKYTVVSTFDSMTMNGKEAPGGDAMKKMKVTAVMDSHGKTLSSTVEGGAPGAQAPEVSGTAFPEKPVKVGDTWDGTTKMSGIEVKAHYKLAKVDGNTATLETTMEGLPNGMTTDGPSITEIDMTTGFPTSVTSKFKMKNPADGKEMTMSMEMKRK